VSPFKERVIKLYTNQKNVNQKAPGGALGELERSYLFFLLFATFFFLFGAAFFLLAGFLFLTAFLTGFFLLAAFFFFLFTGIVILYIK